MKRAVSDVNAIIEGCTTCSGGHGAMKRTDFIQPGPVGSQMEAEQHAETSTCPRCGRPTSSNLPERVPMGFAVRI